MIDSHCHLADEAFAADLDTVIERTRATGLKRVLCILAADENGEYKRAERIASLWPEMMFAVGVHPHHAGGFRVRVDEPQALVQNAVASLPRVRAVGEIGLDYHYNDVPRPLQRAVFAGQLATARSLELPVVVHMRESDKDTLDVLQAEGGGVLRGVFHCFSGDAACVRRAVDLGFFVSFAGVVTFSNAIATREIVRMVPLDRLLVETDSPYLAPVPHRGKRNEPAWVRHIVDAIAMARGQTPAAVEEAVDRNFSILFPD